VGRDSLLASRVLDRQLMAQQIQAQQIRLEIRLTLVMGARLIAVGIAVAVGMFRLRNNP
jgi:hypothetical protein